VSVDATAAMSAGVMGWLAMKRKSLYFRPFTCRGSKDVQYGCECTATLAEFGGWDKQWWSVAQALHHNITQYTPMLCFAVHQQDTE
jgi:hypothetical protein